MVAFLTLLAAAILGQLPFLVIPALIAFAFYLLTSKQSKRKHRKALAEFRAANALQHPDLFNSPPPTDLQSVVCDDVDLYDTETGLHFGRASKQDISTIFAAFDNDPLVFDNGDNDIPFTQDFLQSIEEMPNFKLSQHFIDLMNIAMDRKYLTLVTIRWIPVTKNAT